MTRSNLDQAGQERPASLPQLLLVLTVTTGLIDAVSVLGLGRVFTANMTGNVVFLGFALARVPGFSLVRSLAALAAFLAGAVIGGRLRVPFRGLRPDRPRPPPARWSGPPPPPPRPARRLYSPPARPPPPPFPPSPRPA